MNLPRLEQIDAAFIARMILEKIGVEYHPAQDFPPKPAALTQTIHDIESMESSWRFVPDSNEHTFGRKEAREVIGLWSVPKKSAEVLQNLVAMTKARTVVEVGTSAGYAALHLAYGAKIHDGHIYTIELLKKKANLANIHFQKSGLDNITLLQGEASQILTNWNRGEIDFVFLDADKENYGKYLDLLLPHMKIGGLIVADNINDYGHMMSDYLQRVTGTHLPRSRAYRRVKSYYLAALDNGLMVTKKIA